MVKLIILGASGNIGKQVLDIVRENKDSFKVVGVSLGHDMALANQIIDEFTPEFVVVRKKSDVDLITNKPQTILFGDEGLLRLATYKKEEDILLVSALVGTVGLIPTYEAVKMGRNVALANKETLVMAGDLIMKEAKESGSKIIPIDSEHSAIFECLIGEDISKVKRLIITASGGSLRELADTSHVTKEMVLNHPNWNMGEKITVDSATMMNKGFEVIEAHHLFDMPYDKISVVLHKESIVHSMVEFVDSSIKANLGTPDMRVPISFAINYPNRIKYDNHLDFSLLDLHFRDVNDDRYPCFNLALESGRQGGFIPTILSAANEIAVRLFLANKISYNDIYHIVKSSIERYKDYREEFTVTNIVELDKIVKDSIKEEFGGIDL